METPNPPGNWSEIPLDLLLSLLERLSFVDFHHAKMVCSNWFSVSKLTVPRKNGSPWLMLFPEDGGCVLYNPDKPKYYKTETDFSGTQFLANSGKWFLVFDSGSTLYIVDVISGTRIDLPPLESVLSGTSTVKSVGDGEFRWEFGDDEGSFFKMFSKNLRGRLWVDEKAEEFVVVWFFNSPASFLFSCKKGSDHHTVIPLYDEVPKLLNGMIDLVLLGYRLYILTKRRFVRVIDLSGKVFKDLTKSKPYPMFSPLGMHSNINIAVTTAGEILLVESTTFDDYRSFRIHKKDPNADLYYYSPDLLEVDSIGDGALLLDMGITVPANHSLGIVPNSIYFTSHHRSVPRSLLPWTSVSSILQPRASIASLFWPT